MHLALVMVCATAATQHVVFMRCAIKVHANLASEQWTMKNINTSVWVVWIVVAIAAHPIHCVYFALLPMYSLFYKVIIFNQKFIAIQSKRNWLKFHQFTISQSACILCHCNDCLKWNVQRLNRLPSILADASSKRIAFFAVNFRSQYHIHKCAHKRYRCAIATLNTTGQSNSCLSSAPSSILIVITCPYLVINICAFFFRLH